MLKVTIELIPADNPEDQRTLAEMTIENDCTGTWERGNYIISLYKWTKGKSLWKKGRVEGFERLERESWDLAFLALRALVCDQNTEGDDKSGDR